MTHRDAPGASAVGFVKTREALAADETGVGYQFPSTEEHGPDENSKNNFKDCAAHLHEPPHGV